MSLRARIAVTAALAVGLAVLLVAIVVYGTTARRLESQVDADLDGAVRSVQELAGGAASPAERLQALAELRRDGFGPDRRPGGRRDGRFLGPLEVGTVQVVAADGTARQVGPVELPVDDVALALAEDGGRAARRTVQVDGFDVRVLTVATGDGGALQVGVVVDDVTRALSTLRRQFLLAGLLGAGLAALFGAAVAERAVRPVRRLSEAAEEVGRTGDLGTRIEARGEDELGRLARSFNVMLAGLDEARRAQQQLVADASHELRTPLTSLRTNIEVLQLGGPLDPGERASLLRDVTAQLEEFGRLVDGLVELARGDRPAVAPVPVALAGLVTDTVDRAAVFAPDVRFEVDADDSVVVAERDRLERAVANLLDNAVKHGGGEVVEVEVADGAVRVRDHGAGIAEADLPHVFDRFWRSPDARGRQGSGLGLSIVAQVAAAHGGSCTASTHPDGGAVVELRLPVAAAGG